jgi:chorismate mutase
MTSNGCSVGSDIVRKHVLSPSLCVCVVGALLMTSAASGCRPADGPVAPRSDLADLDRLLRLMEQRLALIHDVARWKWNAGQPITDPEPERGLLQSVVERGRGKGLDSDLLRPFLAAQREAARLVQQADFDRWEANQQQPLANAASLAVPRQRIDELNRDLIDALAEVHPGSPGRACRRRCSSGPRRSSPATAKEACAKRPSPPCGANCGSRGQTRGG